MSKLYTTDSMTAIPPKPSALTTLISQCSSTDPLAALTIQVFHNLQHQHLWTSLKVHNPENGQDGRSSQQQYECPGSSIPVPLISGIPPHRTYTHPDEQLYLLEIGLREEDLPPERVWVLPTTQGQTWTLGKLGTVFDALPPRILESMDYEVRDQDYPDQGSKEDDDNNNSNIKAEKIAQYFEKRREADKLKEWGGKRLLLAMVDRLIGGDGTIVYYVVHDGHMKPRQN